MQIDWWTLGLQTINVLVLVWILSRFLFRPVASMIEERRAATQKLLDEAEAARADAQAEKEKAAQEASSLAAERGRLLKKAADEAEAQKSTLLDAARAEADKLRAEARADIARMRKREETAAGDRAGRLAVDIARKLFTRLPDEARISGFVEGIGEGVAALPEATRSGLGADGAPLRLKAARELTRSELEACRAAVAGALGREVELSVEVDPELIAGLELDAPHAEVRNSFRADLDRIAAELTRHD